MSESYVALDLETTGLNPAQDNILEIGACLAVDGQAIRQYQTFVRCSKPLPFRIKELTGITDEMARTGIEEEQAMREIALFCGDHILLGHNIKFDYSFLKAKAAKYGLTIPNMAIDTLAIARKKLTDLESRSLEALCAYYHIPQEVRHRALDDAYAAMKLYQIFRREFSEEEKLFKPKQLIYRVKKESSITPAQKGFLLDLLKYHGLSLTEDIDALSKSEASKKIDAIIKEHGRIRRSYF